MLANGTYLWGFGCGGGQPTAISELGTNGQYYDVWSLDVVGQDAKVVFVMLFGSWFGNWDDTDDIMRSFLATPSLGLAACMAGDPHWYLHHMGLGETIGFGTRLTMNNSTLYQNQTNEFARAVYVALMGDPTLRMDAVSPPGNLSAAQNGNSVSLTWSASSDSILGYHLYRATNPSGPFLRLTTSLLIGNTFTDPNPPAGTYTYMIRAVKLQTTPSGTYFNPSQGIFSTQTVIPIPELQARASGNSLLLTWNSLPGASYRIQARNDLSPTNWIDLSGTIIATDTLTSWSDTSIHSAPHGFYRVASP